MDQEHDDCLNTDPWNDAGPWKVQPAQADQLRSGVDWYDRRRSGSLDQAGPWMESLQGAQPQGDLQLRLLDLFYATTLFAAVMGLYKFLHPSASVVLSGALLVYAVLRFSPVQYGTLGGLQAFGTSLVCLPLMLFFAELSGLGDVALCLAFPTAAYVLGAIYTELRAMDF